MGVISDTLHRAGAKDGKDYGAYAFDTWDGALIQYGKLHVHLHS